MWSCDRRALLTGLLALAGCGFAPVYGPGGAARGLQGEIAVDPPRDEEGYYLVRELEGRLGRATAPAFALSAEIALERDGLAITPGQDITRYQLVGTVTYTLRRIEDGAVVSRGEVTNFTAYDAPVFDVSRGSIAGNTVSVSAAERAARERLMVALADQIAARLLATAGAWRGAR